MKKIFLFCGFGFFLSACSDSEISGLKEKVYMGYSDYNVGQIFDKRKLCEEVAWDTGAGSRDEVFINYECSIKGAKDYEEKVVEKLEGELYDHVEYISGLGEDLLKFWREEVYETKRNIEREKELAKNNGGKKDDLGFLNAKNKHAEKQLAKYEALYEDTMSKLNDQAEGVLSST